MKKLLLICLLGLGLGWGLQAQSLAIYVNGTQMHNGDTLVLSYITDPDEVLHAFVIFENTGEQDITVKGRKQLDFPEELVNKDFWCFFGECQGEVTGTYSLEVGEVMAGEGAYFGILPQGYVGEGAITYTFTTEGISEEESLTFTLHWKLLESKTERMKIYLDADEIQNGQMYKAEFALTDDAEEIFHLYAAFENPGKDTVVVYGEKQAFLAGGVFSSWCMFRGCHDGDKMEGDRRPLTPGELLESDKDDEYYLSYTPNGYVGTGYVYYTFYDKNKPENCLHFAVEWKTTEKPTAANEKLEALKTAVYPNPAVETARLTWEAVEGAVVLNVRSVSGQLLYSRPVEGLTEAEINVANFTPGMYFYSLERQGERLGSGKLLVR